MVTATAAFCRMRRGAGLLTMRVSQEAHDKGARLPLLLVYLRYVVVCAGAVALVVAHSMMRLGPALWPLIVTLVLMLAGNIAAHLWLRRQGDEWPVLFTMQLLFDVGALTVVMHFSGGPANPFISLYLLPVTMAAAISPPRSAILVTLAAIAAYTGLLWGHRHLMHLGGDGFATHVTGMWIEFIFSAVLLLVVLARFRTLLARQRARLAQSRERALRDESLIAVGTLAAGTAHELNTPLTTLGMLVDDMHAGDVLSADDLDLIRSQLARCREHVAALASLARRGADEARVVNAEDFVREALERWSLMRPGVEVHFVARDPSTRIRADASLAQALLNLLNNAADANVASGSGESLELQSGQADGRWSLRIFDRGPGTDGAVAAMAGKARYGGLGIGLMISNASVERSGGQVRRFARPDGGSVTELILPVAE